MATFNERLKQYSRPLDKRNWQGTGRDEACIARWSERAAENSQLAPRASSEMKLPNTGKSMSTRDSSMRPYAKRGDARAEAKADKNNVDSSDYLAGIKTQA